MIPCKIYASGTTSADNVANINVPVSGKIALLNGSLRLAGSSAPICLIQVSLQSTGQFATNDVRNVIAEVELTADTTTANNVNFSIPIPNWDVKAGDKIYVHRLVAGTVTASVLNLNVWL